MKKLLLVSAAILLLAGLAAPAIEAQQCLKWVVFCDGIQIDKIQAGWIDAQWYHIDCANNADIFGVLMGAPNACTPGRNGRATIVCDDCSGPGFDFYFVIDAPLDGTLDMHSGVPWELGACWIDELAYNHFMGPCVGAPQEGPGLTSSIQ